MHCSTRWARRPTRRSTSYMNQKKVPQLFVATGASKWGKPKEFPWTMGFQPDYHTEAVIYAKHILATVKDAKIGVLMQNDDYGKDYWEGFKEGLGKDVNKVVKHVTYEIDRPDGRQPDHPAQGFRRQRLLQHRDPEVRRPGDPQGRRSRLEAGAVPQQRLVLGRVDAEAGRPRQQPGHHHGAVPHGSHRQAVGQQRRHEGLARLDGQVHAGRQQGRRQLRLRLCRLVPDGGDAEAVRRHADAREPHEAGGQLQEVQRVPLLLPGITVSTSPTDFYPIQSVQLARFKGETWELFGDIMSAEGT